MTGSVALDVVIGLVFIYLLYSLLASLLQEMVATYLSFRAKILEKGIVRMLQDNTKDSTVVGSRWNGWAHLLFFKKIIQDDSFASKFYKHPLIKYLGEDCWHNKPSYLDAKNFSKVIIDLLRGSQVSIGDDQRAKIEHTLNPDLSTESTMPLENKIEKSKEISPETAHFLYSLWVDAQGDIEKFKELLEAWFNATMERTTGWYKRYNQSCLLVLGLLIAIVFNVDSIQIAQKLSNDPAARKLLVEQSGNFIKEHPTLQADMQERQKRIDDLLAAKENKTKKDTVSSEKEKNRLDSIYQSKINRIDALQKTTDSLINNDIITANKLLALGWGDQCKIEGSCKVCHFAPNGFSWYSIIGWMLTALALSLGAPFWFDLLNKLMKFRGAIPAATIEGAIKGDVRSSSKINRVG